MSDAYVTPRDEDAMTFLKNAAAETTREVVEEKDGAPAAEPAATGPETNVTPANLQKLSEGGGKFYRVDPRILKPSGLNARDFSSPVNIEHVARLKALIVEHGYDDTKPMKLMVDTGELLIIDGESRWRAVMAAIEEGYDIKSVPALAERKGVTEEQRLLEPIVANTGKPLEPLELAERVAVMTKRGWTDAQIAKAIALSEVRVQQLHEIAALSKPLKTVIIAGKMTTSGVMKIVQKSPDQKTAFRAIAEALADMSAPGKGKGKNPGRLQPKAVIKAAAKGGVELGKRKKAVASRDVAGLEIMQVIKTYIAQAKVRENTGTKVIVEFAADKWEKLRSKLDISD